MEENKKSLVIAAMVVVLGGNASGIVSALDPDFRASAFSGLDAEKLKHELRVETQARNREIESRLESMQIRLSIAEFKINDCVRKVGP